MWYFCQSYCRYLKLYAWNIHFLLINKQPPTAQLNIKTDRIFNCYQRLSWFEQGELHKLLFMQLISDPWRHIRQKFNRNRKAGIHKIFKYCFCRVWTQSTAVILSFQYQSVHVDGAHWRACPDVWRVRREGSQWWSVCLSVARIKGIPSPTAQSTLITVALLLDFFFKILLTLTWALQLSPHSEAPETSLALYHVFVMSRWIRKPRGGSD